MKHVVVGTAGHIDHGKSALVRALTGTDPDRLKEEKERGITIDLGFAFLGGPDELSLGFVDVPGHEKFVKNMLAGVGGIDLVLLVIAADESVMPQTREHFEICRLLRIPRGMVVVTKCDLVDEEIVQLAELEARELVEGSFLEGAPVLHVSARTGEGLDALRDALFRMAGEVPGRSSSGLFRLPVDRVFTMRGFGTVVTGTLVSGSISQDEEVEILPGGGRARVRGLQVHGERRETVAAGQRTAVNLQGVDFGELDRGSALVRPKTFEPTRMLDAEVEVLASSPIRVKDLARVHLHLGTAQVLARARVLGGRGALAPGETGVVQLRLEAPVVAARGDRFILRRYSPLETIAGGRVLDAYPKKHSVTSRAVLDALETLRAGAEEDVAFAFIAESGLSGLSERRLALRLGLDEAALGRVAEALVAHGRVVAVGKTPRNFVLQEILVASEERILAELRRYQKKHPLLKGMPKSELKDKAARGLAPELFDWVLGAAAERGKLRLDRDLVATPEHRIQMSSDEEAVRDLLVEAYRREGLAPKSLRETADKTRKDVKLLERVQRVLLKDGTLVQIGDGMIFHREALEALKERLREYRASHDRIDVSGFKDLVGVTRKHAIPLLEWLDRERVTQRAGNERLLL